MRWLLSFIVLALMMCGVIFGDVLPENPEDFVPPQSRGFDSSMDPNYKGVVPFTIPYNGWDTSVVEKDKVKIDPSKVGSPNQKQRWDRDDGMKTELTATPYNGWNTGTNLTPAWSQGDFVEPISENPGPLPPQIWGGFNSDPDYKGIVSFTIPYNGWDTSVVEKDKVKIVKVKAKDIPSVPCTIPYDGWDTGINLTPAWSQTKDGFLYFDKKVSSNLLDYANLSKEVKEKDKEAAEARAGHPIKPGTPFTIPYSGWDTEILAIPAWSQSKDGTKDGFVKGGGVINFDVSRLSAESIAKLMKNSAPSGMDVTKFIPCTIPYSGWDTGSVSAFSVPEPSTLALLGMGAFGFLAWAWRRR